jgi:uncharacterized surface protein with fasciclin (FAS1) repeats
VPPCVTAVRSCLQLLAPTDAAFEQLLVNLGAASGQPLPLDALLAQPTLMDILMYHIIPGRYSSGERESHKHCVERLLQQLTHWPCRFSSCAAFGP